MIKIKNFSKKLRYFKNYRIIIFCNYCLVGILLLLSIHFGYQLFYSKQFYNVYKNYLLKLDYIENSNYCTFDNQCIKDFTLNDNGWYTISKDNKEYLIVEAATVECRDSTTDSKCIEVRQNGIADNIHYYQIGETFSIQIGGKTYDAIVLNSCIECMSKDYEGKETFRILKEKDGVNPSIYKDIQIVEKIASTNVPVKNFETTYEGDITKGYIYQTQKKGKLKIFTPETAADIIETRVKQIINDIFGRAKYTKNTNTQVGCSAFRDLKVKVTDYEGNVYDIVSFEEYIMGVLAFEERGNFLTPGNEEYKKAFIIAATSFSLSLNNYREGMNEITLKSGTANQGWCDIYKGCHQKTSGKKLYGDYSVAPGPNENGIYDAYKVGQNATPPLTDAQISDLKSIMNSVFGTIRMDNNQILLTQYNTSANVGTNKMRPAIALGQSKSGWSYEQILDYWYTGSNARIGGNVCGVADDWKQYNDSWSKIPLGGSTAYTIGNAGCLAVSIAIQIKRSNTKINISDFNPGTFVQSLNQNSGFTSGGLFKWQGAWKVAVPNFEYYNQDKLPNTKSGKILAIQNLLNQGYYLAMCVKPNCGHWVAVTGVSEDNIMISDPGSNATTVWPTYSNISDDATLNVAKFKKLD